MNLIYRQMCAFDGFRFIEFDPLRPVGSVGGGRFALSAFQWLHQPLMRFIAPALDGLEANEIHSEAESLRDDLAINWPRCAAELGMKDFEEWRWWISTALATTGQRGRSAWAVAGLMLIELSCRNSPIIEDVPNSLGMDCLLEAHTVIPYVVSAYERANARTQVFSDLGKKAGESSGRSRSADNAARDRAIRSAHQANIGAGMSLSESVRALAERYSPGQRQIRNILRRETN